MRRAIEALAPDSVVALAFDTDVAGDKLAAAVAGVARGVTVEHERSPVRLARRPRPSVSSFPCYLFVIIPASYFRRFADNPRVKAFVDGVSITDREAKWVRLSRCYFTLRTPSVS